MSQCASTVSYPFQKCAEFKRYEVDERRLVSRTLTVETDEEFRHILHGDHAAVIQARRRGRCFATPAAVHTATARRGQRLLPDERAHGRSSER